MDLGSKAIDAFERFPVTVDQAILLRQGLVGSQASEIDRFSDETWRVVLVTLCLWIWNQPISRHSPNPTDTSLQ